MTISLDRDIVFLDVETRGLERNAPIWEFAAIRICGNELVDRAEFFIQHDPNYRDPMLPAQFNEDYRARYDLSAAWTVRQAARDILAITRDAIVAGSNPVFDMDRLEILLHKEKPEWYYHPLDIPSMVLGHLVMQANLIDGPKKAGEFRSNALSRAVGVDPDFYARHTAMGDVRWCLAQWRAMTGRVDGERLDPESASSELIGLPDAARRCGVHYRTVRRWVADGRINAVRVGPRLLKVRTDDLDKLLQPVGRDAFGQETGQ